MIRLKHVNKTYNKHRANEIRAINDTTIDLPDKGLVTFLGESGCGKTTLLNAIGGLDRVDSGEIWLDNERLTRRTAGKRDEIRNRKIGYIFQNYNLIDDATVFDNVAIVLKMIGFTDRAAIERRVMYVLERVGIARYRRRPAKMLSGGERQRVGIARAIVKNPDIIIADEPTGNLDSTNTIEVMNIIKAISREKLVILVTHERRVAEFYADRIIEIVDGKIVSDRENANAGSLDYRLDNKIYLQDLPVQEDLSQDGMDVRFYSDRPEKPARIRIVIRDNNLYIDTGGALNVGSSDVELVDDHYRELSRDVYDSYEFHYDEYFRNAENMDAEGRPRAASGSHRGIPKTPKYHSIYGPFSSLGAGFRTVKNYSRLKRILLIGFILASIFVVDAVSSVAGATHITDDRFVSVNQEYLSARTGSFSPALYNKLSKAEGIRYALPGDSILWFTLPIGDYEQSAGMTATLTGSLTDAADLTEEDLIAGRLPQDSHEIVIDRLAVRDLLRYNANVTSIGLTEPEHLVGRTAILPHLPEYTIVGLTDRQFPGIYMDPSQFQLAIAVGSVPDDSGDAAMLTQTATSSGQILSYGFVSDDPTIQITKGEAPKSDFQVLIPADLEVQYPIGKSVETKINGETLTVSGYYHDDRGGGAFYVNQATYLAHAYATLKNITLVPEDKAQTLADYEGSDTRVTDVYAETRDKYIRSLRNDLIRTLAMAAIILAISLIEIYLMLRASFLSRIREVGILRAIGLKKGDIYRMFTGEVLAITILTAVPGITFMSLLLHAMGQIEFFADSFRINPLIAGLSFLIILVFNLLAGLFPVFRTLRKTPVAILSRNDVN